MSERCFRLLIRLYPRSFRTRFHDEMLELFRRERVAQSHGLKGRLSFAVRISCDVIQTAASAWLRHLLHGDAETGLHGEDRNVLESFTADIRYAVRALLARPAFTIVVVATLSLGIGANTAIFTVVNEIALRSLPIGDPAGVVDVFADTPGGNSFTGFSYLDFLDYRERNSALSDLGVYTGRSLPLGPSGADGSVRVQFSSANYFDLLQVRPSLGRAFRPEEDLPGQGSRVAVASYAFWQRQAGGDPKVLGSELVLNNISFTVIGIGPEGFGGTFIGFPMDVWVPMTSAELVLTNFDLADRRPQGLEMIGRLCEGVSASQARLELARIAGQLEKEHPVEGDGRGVGVVAATGIDRSMRGAVLGFLAVLMTVTVLVLSICCLNIGGMLLARATARRKEMAIRLAMGAGRGRIVRQLLTEVFLLFALGALAGSVVADRMTEVLHLLVESSGLPISFNFAPDLRVLGFTAGLAFVTALVAGLFPAREALSQDPVDGLKSGSGAVSLRRGWLRDAFVVVQIAGAVVLLTGAGLFVRSLLEGARLDPGFEADRVAGATLTLPEGDYDEARGLQLLSELQARLSRIRGVEAVAVADRPPIGVALSPKHVEIGGFRLPDGQSDLFVDTSAVGETYLSALGIPILAGRDFSRADSRGPGAAVINEAMAERFWPGRDAVGRSFQISREEYQVVGIAADSRNLIQSDRPMPHVYIPLARAYSGSVTVLVRSAVDVAGLRARVQSVLTSLDPNLAPVGLFPLRESIDSALLPQRVAVSVTAGLGVFGMGLALLGVYAILAEAVSRRTREIGIRMALGSTSAEVVGLILRYGLRLLVPGVAVGALIAVGLAPLAGSYLIGVRPGDPPTFIAVISLFLTIGLAACLPPARRAAAVDPMQALRFD